MRVYSAAEAIWPALLRTYGYLFRPFNWEEFLKLGTVSTLCEGFVVSFRFLVPNTFPFGADGARLRALLIDPAFLPVSVLGAIAVVLAAVLCFYLLTQLRFGFIHTLIHQTRQLRFATRLYLKEAEGFFAASALVWLGFLVLGVAAMLLVVVAGYAVAETPSAEGKLDPGHLPILFFPCLAVVVVLLLLAFTAGVILNDFILPHMAIEGARFSTAWTEARRRIAANRETFLSFLMLRLAMPIALGMFLALIAWLAGWLVFGLLGMSAAGFAAMLDGGGGARNALLAVIRTLFLVLGLGAGWVLAVTFSGPLGVFMRSYALYFYGGHYKALGNLLEPADPAVDRDANQIGSKFP